MAEISGREVDFRKIQDIAAESAGYAKNYVKVDTENLSEAQKDNLINGNGAYVMTKEEASKRAKHMAQLALAFKKIAEEADDVKDDEGMHSDGEFIHIDKHGDEYLVHIDKEPEQKFDSLHEALDYVMTMHGDDRFEKDVTDEKEEKEDEEKVKKDEEEAKRAAKFRAIYEAKKRAAGRKAAAINSKKASLAPRIATASDADPCSKGLYR